VEKVEKMAEQDEVVLEQQEKLREKANELRRMRREAEEGRRPRGMPTATEREGWPACGHVHEWLRGMGGAQHGKGKSCPFGLGWF